MKTLTAGALAISISAAAGFAYADGVTDLKDTYNAPAVQARHAEPMKLTEEQLDKVVAGDANLLLYVYPPNPFYPPNPYHPPNPFQLALPALVAPLGDPVMTTEGQPGIFTR
jgi:hypothetical protein